MLFPVITKTVCCGRSMVRDWPKILSDHTEAVTARARFGDATVLATLSKIDNEYPAERTAVSSFRNSSSSRVGAGCITAFVPVMINATVSASNDLPVPAAGASINARGTQPRIALRRIGVSNRANRSEERHVKKEK